jgi:glutathione synthase/RimK-type ligase-like ATP-grasp enzyme
MYTSAVILNSGPGAWAFEDHAARLSRALWVDVCAEPADYIYLLAWDAEVAPDARLFIPFEAMRTGSDKRLVADAFDRGGVPTPLTMLLDTADEVRERLASEPARQWVLKWPTGCGGAGHRLLAEGDTVPDDWPRPYVLQEFIPMFRPEVYRAYGAGDEVFGWNARRYAAEVPVSVWVAHARGAHYEVVDADEEAEAVARAALDAVGLTDSFGCVDLLRSERGWLALEVGTDGVYNHVDRDLGLPTLEEEIDRRVAAAFWRSLGGEPWGGRWRYRK